MHDDTAFTEFVTFTIAGQTFGLPIGRVQDVFKPARITRVPLAAAEVAGVLNLRGRIVTAIDMRHRLGVQKRDEGATQMAIGIEAKGKSSVCWSTPSARCSSCRISTASPIRSISTANSRRCRPASTGSTVSFLSFSTSTGCSTCAASRWRRERSIRTMRESAHSGTSKRVRPRTVE